MRCAALPLTSFARHSYLSLELKIRMRQRAALLKHVLVCALTFFCTSAEADNFKSAGVVASSLGATAKGTPIRCLIGAGDLDVTTKKTRILLVGEDGRTEEQIVAAMRWFHTAMEAEDLRKRYTLSAVPCAYPGEILAPVYSLRGRAYPNDGHPEEAYLWRWIGMHAPDLVVTVGIGKWFNIGVPKSKLPQLANLAKEHRGTVFRADSLEAQLVTAHPAGVGSIPAISYAIPVEQSIHEELFKVLDKAEFTGPSPARVEIQNRRNRTPRQIAEQLAAVYGRELPNITYIPAVAAIGQARLAKLTDDADRQDQVKKLAALYLNETKSPAVKSPVNWAGHLFFAELAEHAKVDERERYVNLAKSAADQLLDEQGKANLKKLSSSQMSDAVFMGGPILARIGRLTGEAKYFNAAAAHVENMAAIDMREDGLYRHSPLNEAAWGRGNGFPALGLAMILSDVPEDHPQRKKLLALYQQHMQALAQHQDYTGTWHQVIDHEESYRELSCTCMIAFAMARGVQREWLDRERFQPIVEQAWWAIRTRVAADGNLVDVCTGTGKQRSLRAYFDRTAILGRDSRGGAMALLVAVELAGWRDFSPEETE